MKRLHRIAQSCCLSFLRFVMFLNLSSVKAFALEFSAYDGYNVFFSNYLDPNVSKIQVNSYDTNNNWQLGFEQTTEYLDGVHHVQNPDLIGYNVVSLYSSGYPFLFPVNTDVYDYYLVGVIQYLGGNQVNWSPNRVQVTYRATDGSNVYASHYFSSAGNNLIANNVGETRGYSWSVKLDLTSNSGIQNISLIAPYSSSSFIGSYIDFSAAVVQIHKSVSQAEVNSIITAIHNQTDTISGVIGDAADQVTDKIDEVLTPEGENNLGEYVDQIKDQIDDNLGALGFAHETVENFIGLFNEEPPAPVISVPPLKMKIDGVEHQFFNGYVYDIRTLESGPLNFLIKAVRFACSGILWWAFLSYCFDEFEDLFRR